jgi:hypothetical protein
MRGGAMASRSSFHFVARHMREADRAMPNSLDDDPLSSAHPGGPSPTKRPRYKRYAQARLSVQAPPIPDPTPPPSFRVRRLQPPAPVSTARADPITTPVFTTPRVKPPLGAGQLKAYQTETGSVCRRISLGDGTPLHSPTDPSGALGTSLDIQEYNFQYSVCGGKDVVQSSMEESPGMFTQQRPLTLITCASDEFPICAQSLNSISAVGNCAVGGIAAAAPPISGTRQAVHGREPNSHPTRSMAQCRAPETGDGALELDVRDPGNELLSVAMMDAVLMKQAHQQSVPNSGAIRIEPEDEIDIGRSGSCEDVLLLDSPVVLDSTRHYGQPRQDYTGECSSTSGLYSNQPALSLETISPSNNGPSLVLPVQRSSGPFDGHHVTDNMPISTEMLHATSQGASVIERQCMSEYSDDRRAPSELNVRHRSSERSKPVPNPSKPVKPQSMLSESQQLPDKSQNNAGMVRAGNSGTLSILRTPSPQTQAGGLQIRHEEANALQLLPHPVASEHDVEHPQTFMPAADEICHQKHPAVREMLARDYANIRDGDTGDFCLHPVHPPALRNLSPLHQSCVGNMNAATISPPHSFRQQIRAISPAGFGVPAISSSSESTVRDDSSIEIHADMEFTDCKARDVQVEITRSHPFQSEQNSSETISNDQKMPKSIVANLQSSPSTSSDMRVVINRTLPAPSFCQGYEYNVAGECADVSLFAPKELRSTGSRRRPEHESSSSTDPPPDDDDEDMNLWRRRMARGTQKSSDSEGSSEEQEASVSKNMVYITAGLDIAVSEEEDSSSSSEPLPSFARTGFEENNDLEPTEHVHDSSVVTVSNNFGTYGLGNSRRTTMAAGLNNELSNEKYNSTAA